MAQLALSYRSRGQSDKADASVSRDGERGADAP
jgi:hypothetical protein